jgi:Chaperone of endosialidase
LGNVAGAAVSNVDNVIAISALGQNVSNTCFIGQIYTNIQPQVGTDPDLVTINSNGRLGRANVSSRRYKHDIQPMHTASEAIYALKPVSFRYHKQYDQTQTIAFGLIAEEVADANPDLVGRNPEGQPESVRYEQINAMLLNEFLKEHRKGEEQDCKIQEQETTITELRSEIRNLAVLVNEQGSELRKVSAQLQIGNAAAQAIASNPR